MATCFGALRAVRVNRLLRRTKLQHMMATCRKRKEWLVQLNMGAQRPALGFGTWMCDGSAVEAALRAGFRSINTAPTNGNEAEIGEAVQKCIKEGVVKRNEVFVAAKLWITQLAREDVLPACQQSLKNLQLDYVDLYSVMWPVSLRKGAVGVHDPTDDDKLGYDPEKIANCWEGMEELVEKGLAKAIGISNFTITKTERLLQTAKIPPAVNEVECHPYFQQPKLKEYCDSIGILLQAYYPLGNPSSPLRKIDDPNILEDPVIQQIAAKHGATAAQVCIAFSLYRGLMAIPKSSNPARIIENFKSTELILDTEDMSRLRALDRNYRMLTGEFLMKDDVSVDDFWDVLEDEKFVVVSN